MKDVGSAFFLQCNFSTAFLPSTLPQFYKECLVAWADLFQRTPETSNNVLNAIIWNNKDIQIGEKPIYNKRLLDAGFTRVRDILSNDNKLKNWEAIEAINLSMTDYFLSIGIYSAMPSSWKRLLNTEIGLTGANLSQSNTSVDSTSLNSKSVYKELIEKCKIPPTAQSKYNSIYCDEATLDWKEIYLLPGRVSIDTYSRNFNTKY